MKKLLKIMLAVVLSLAFLTGCTNQTKTITTTVYPVAYLIDRLTDKRIDVVYLNSDEFISRAQIKSNYNTILNDTNLFIYINELESYMEIYNSEIQQHEIEIIDLAGLSAIDDFARYSKTVVNGVTITTEKPYYDDAAFSMVDIYDKDPFIWLDPIAMSSMASTIKDWLVNHYPENALTFENNFKTLQAELIRLDAEYQQLKTRTNVKFVSVAPTFGNWQKSYGVQVYPLILSRYGVLPTDNQLAIIEASIKEAGVKYIAYDDSLPEDMLALYEKVKTDLKLTAVELSSVSRLSADDVEKGKDYLTIMYENLTNLENMTD